MYCYKCGKKLDDNAKFCEGCGAPIDCNEIPEQNISPAAPDVSPRYPSMQKSGGIMNNFVKGIIIILIIVFAVYAIPHCRKPPIEISFRDSLMVSGKVLQVTNLSDGEFLLCQLTAENHRSNEKLRYQFTVKPRRSCEEIGVLETNWTFVPGETGKIYAEGYWFPVTFRVP